MHCLTYVCKIEKLPKAGVKDSRLYHAGTPTLTRFGKNGFIWKLLSALRGKTTEKKTVDLAESTNINLVMQSDPSLLASIARDLYGMEVDGSNVEITILPARLQTECKPQPV